MKRDGAVELAVRDELARMESVVVGLAVVKRLLLVQVGQKNLLKRWCGGLDLDLGCDY
jgi:hypothetical protein